MDLCPARYLSSGLFLIRNGWNAGQPISELTYWFADQLTYILTLWPILHRPTNCGVTRLAHKSSFWARSAIVRAPSAKRERASESSYRVLSHQTRKPCERLWESLRGHLLTYWPTDVLTEWLTNLLTRSLIDWLTDRLKTDTQGDRQTYWHFRPHCFENHSWSYLFVRNGGIFF